MRRRHFKHRNNSVMAIRTHAHPIQILIYGKQIAIPEQCHIKTKPRSLNIATQGLQGIPLQRYA